MSLASYRKRVLSTGKNIKEGTLYETKMNQFSYILDSPSRSDVIINMDEVNPLPSIVSDIDTFEYRKFLFCPDLKLYIGDYICHDNFVYLAIKQTTDSAFPQLYGQLCNFDFPLEQRIKETQIGTKPNGEPIMKKEITYLTKPCVMTTNIYSTFGNSQIVLPEGSMMIYLPYAEHEPIPQLNQVIDTENAQYKVADLSYQKVIQFGSKRKGYIEIRLQRVMNTNDKTI
jgi:hypothetical protein